MLIKKILDIAILLDTPKSNLLNVLEVYYETIKTNGIIDVKP